jgi:hypothetical protein
VIASSLLDVGVAPKDPAKNPLTVRQQEAAAVAGIVAVGDPWTALGMIVHGKTIWKAEK